MQYTYLSAHAVKGISHPYYEADIVLFENKSQNIRVLLTSNVIEHLRVLHRQTALFSMLIRGKIKTPTLDGFSEDLAEEIKTSEHHCLSLIGNDPVILIEQTGEVKTDIPENALKIEDFIICSETFDKKTLHESLQSKVNGVLTALRLSAVEKYEYRQISHGSYLINFDGKIIHSSSAQFFPASVYISRALTPEQLVKIADDI